MSDHSAQKATQRLLTVSEIAKSVGVPDHVVRFYARAGLIRAARRAANGYRHFAPFDVKRVGFIRMAQRLGFSLTDISELMRLSRRGTSPCPLAREIIERRLAENRENLAAVQALQDRMEQASGAWRTMPDQAPKGDTLCALIEAVAAGDTNLPPATRRRRSTFGRRSEGGK